MKDFKIIEMVRLKSKFLIFILLLILININIYSQNIRIHSYIDTNTVLIGDTLRLSLVAESTKEWKIIFPEIPNQLNGIDVRSKSLIDTVKTDSSNKLIQIIGLQPFDTGNFTIPQLLFQAINLSSSQQEQVLSDSIVLTVNTFRSDTAKTIIDIKAPLEEPLTFWDYLPYIIAGLLVIAGAYFAYRLWKKRKKEPKESIKLDIEKIHYVWAMEELGKLQKEQLWQKGKFKLHFTKLSDILRTYIEKKFETPALEMTTFEIIDSLRMISMPSEFLNQLKEILNLSDLVKFAKHIPTENGCVDSFNNSIEFVKKTGTHNLILDIAKQEVSL
jgi:hypothetical protein